jgi:hypothetical protein
LNELDVERLFTITGQYFTPLLECFGGTSKHDVADSFQAEAFSGFIRGLAPYTAGIVMRGQQGQLWAAYVRDDIFRYFTTEPEFKRQPPLTITRWLEHMQYKETIFPEDVKVIPVS